MAMVPTQSIFLNRSGTMPTLGELALVFRFFKRGLRVRILPCPPDSLQTRELFSDSSRNTCFTGLFLLPDNQNEHQSSRQAWVLGRFSLVIESAVPFQYLKRHEIELLANSSVWGTQRMPRIVGSITWFGTKGVGGLSPLSPTILFNRLQSISGLSPSPL
jgi:hypothetical protein